MFLSFALQTIKGWKVLDMQSIDNHCMSINYFANKTFFLCAHCCSKWRSFGRHVVVNVDVDTVLFLHRKSICPSSFFVFEIPGVWAPLICSYATLVCAWCPQIRVQRPVVSYIDWKQLLGCGELQVFFIPYLLWEIGRQALKSNPKNPVAQCLLTFHLMSSKIC